MKRKSSIEWIFKENIATVWTIVTDLQQFSWRSDIQTIKILSPTTFIEVYKGGGQTTFTIVEQKEQERYAFTMDNRFFSGQWFGEFVKINQETTKVVFTEVLDFNNPVVYILSFLMIPLKKIQKTYLLDLEKRLANDH